MNTTFNSVEFSNLKQTFASSASAIIENIAQISNHCSWAADSYKSEDSALAAGYTEVNETLAIASTKFNEIYAKLSLALEKYMNETVANETGAQNTLKQVTSDMNAANSALGNL